MTPFSYPEDYQHEPAEEPAGCLPYIVVGTLSGVFFAAVFFGGRAGGLW